MSDASGHEKLPDWVPLLIVLACIGGLLMLAMVIVFLWPWVVAFS